MLQKQNSKTYVTVAIILAGISGISSIAAKVDDLFEIVCKDKIQIENLKTKEQCMSKFEPYKSSVICYEHATTNTTIIDRCSTKRRED